MRVLPYWPRERYIELAPNCWRATRAALDPKELELPIGAITVPAVLAARRHNPVSPSTWGPCSAYRRPARRRGSSRRSEHAEDLGENGMIHPANDATARRPDLDDHLGGDRRRRHRAPRHQRHDARGCRRRPRRQPASPHPQCRTGVALAPRESLRATTGLALRTNTLCPHLLGRCLSRHAPHDAHEVDAAEVRVFVQRLRRNDSGQRAMHSARANASPCVVSFHRPVAMSGPISTLSSEELRVPASPVR